MTQRFRVDNEMCHNEACIFPNIMRTKRSATKCEIDFKWHHSSVAFQIHEIYTPQPVNCRGNWENLYRTYMAQCISRLHCGMMCATIDGRFWCEIRVPITSKSFNVWSLSNSDGATIPRRDGSEQQLSATITNESRTNVNSIEHIQRPSFRRCTRAFSFHKNRKPVERRSAYLLICTF